MTHEQFEQLLSNPDFLRRERYAEVVSPEVAETHISYVILTKSYAYKIKKTLQLEFLDFSTLPLRRHYCEQELHLNRRFAPNMYLDVLPIKRHHGQLYIGEGEGETVDYALKMRRMDNRLEMDRMLANGEVEAHHIAGLAHRMADFHGAAPLVRPTITVAGWQSLFSPLGQLTDYIDQTLGRAYGDTVRRAIRVSDRFVRKHLPLMQQRSARGLVRDVHGDLHSKNIFLTDPPTLFDCIEFEPAYRQIDLLSEVAFLCMDLEAYGADALSAFLYQEYLIDVEANGVDGVRHDALFAFFKLYRANVRAKVLLLQAQEAHVPTELLTEAKTYLALMKRYLSELPVRETP
jgi:aminoglycoside phosphotransferase family enzyme